MDQTLRRTSIILVIIGSIITAYLSYTKLANTHTVCLEGSAFDCASVQSSVYAELLGVPIAFLGLTAYVMLGGMLVLEQRIVALREYGISLAVGLTLFGFLYSAWLTYLEFFQLEALCIWCLVSASVMTALFALTGLRFGNTMVSAPILD